MSCAAAAEHVAAAQDMLEHELLQLCKHTTSLAQNACSATEEREEHLCTADSMHCRSCFVNNYCSKQLLLH